MSAVDSMASWAPRLEWGRGSLALDVPRVMGILNVTPDSFSDGGKYLDPGRAVAHAHEMIDAGAAIIDVGGESTRPGANEVPADEELRRVLPVVQRLAAEVDVPISVDTGKSEVIKAVTDAGASLINDVYALRLPGAIEAAASADCAVCLMHMLGEPRTMQAHPRYDNVVEEVCEFLEHRANACVDAGIPPDRILLDPGFGFGKSLEHNLDLLRHLPELLDLGYPVLVGLSRKSSIARITGVKDPSQRVPGSLAAASLAVWLGASVVRAHDVAPTVQALAVIHAARRQA